MKGLILKDLYNLTRTLKLMLAMLLLMSFFFLRSGITFLCSYLIVMCSMLVVTTMSYDDLAKWDHYALTLPLSRRDIVLGKYGTMLALNLIGALLSLLVGLPMLAIDDSLSVGMLLATATGSLLAGLIYAAACIPLLYRFGTEKARLLMILLLMVPSFGLAGLVRYFPDLFGWVAGTSPAMLVASALFVTVALVIGSIFLSVRIYNKKEF